MTWENSKGESALKHVYPGQSLRFPVEKKGRFVATSGKTWLETYTIKLNPPPMEIDDSGFLGDSGQRQLDLPGGRNSCRQPGAHRTLGEQWLERLDRVGFCRSRGLAAAHYDAAVHEAEIGHKPTFVVIHWRFLLADLKGADAYKRPFAIKVPAAGNQPGGGLRVATIFV